MKYTKEQRLDIGRRIYDGEINRYQAAEEYGISESTARDYMRLYRNVNQLPYKLQGNHKNISVSKTFKPDEQQNLEAYESMSKEELIRVLIQARIREARLKKGYEKKGDGSIIQYSSKNTR